MLKIPVSALVDDASVEYSRFNISDPITFGFVTVELPVGRSQYYPDAGFVEDYCSRDGCLLESAVVNNTSRDIAIQPRVQVTSICVNDDGIEDLTWFITNYSDDFNQCNRTSNTSMLVVSVGKRIEGGIWDTTRDGDPHAKIRFENLYTVHSITVVVSHGKLETSRGFSTSTTSVSLAVKTCATSCNPSRQERLLGYRCEQSTDEAARPLRSIEPGYNQVKVHRFSC